MNERKYTLSDFREDAAFTLKFVFVAGMLFAAGTFLMLAVEL